MRPLIYVLLTVTLISPVWGDAPPKAEQSEYLVTRGPTGFACSPNSLIYVVSFEVRKKNLPKPLYAVVRFENPADPTTPLEVTATINGGDKQLKAESPALPFIKADKLYAVDVNLFTDEAHSQIVGQHHQDVLPDSSPAALAAFTKFGCNVQTATGPVSVPVTGGTAAGAPTPPGMAVLYLLNGSTWTMLPHSQDMTDNDKQIASLPHQTYTRLLINPGSHVLRSKPFLWKQEVTLNAEPGITYYVLVVNGGVPPVVVRQLGEGEARSRMERMKAQDSSAQK